MVVVVVAQLAECRCNSLHYTNVTVEGVLLSAAQINSRDSSLGGARH